VRKKDEIPGGFEQGAHLIFHGFLRSQTEAVMGIKFGLQFKVHHKITSKGSKIDCSKSKNIFGNS